MSRALKEGVLGQILRKLNYSLLNGKELNFFRRMALCLSKYSARLQSGLISISVRQANLSMKPFCEKKCLYEVFKLQNKRKAEKIFIFQRVKRPNLIKRNHF